MIEGYGWWIWWVMRVVGSMMMVRGCKMLVFGVYCLGLPLGDCCCGEGLKAILKVGFCSERNSRVENRVFKELRYAEKLDLFSVLRFMIQKLPVLEG
jgi:hypothetical protein